MKLVAYIRATWRRFLLRRNNRRITVAWAREVADLFTDYQIQVLGREGLEDAFELLESKQLTQEAGAAMADLFAEPESIPGPFARRLENAKQG